MSLIMGIDPSLTSTGIIVLRDSNVELAETTKNRPELGTLERVKAIRTVIDDIINYLATKEEEWQSPDLIVIEGFSYGSKGQKLFEIAYLGWRIREDLESLKALYGIPWIEASPSQLKKFATGKGEGDKAIILQQVYKRWGIEFKDNNQADAFVLAKIGEAYLGGEGLTSFQQEVITSLKTPKVKKSKKKAGDTP